MKPSTGQPRRRRELLTENVWERIKAAGLAGAAYDAARAGQLAQFVRRFKTRNPAKWDRRRRRPLRVHDFGAPRHKI